MSREHLIKSLPKEVQLELPNLVAKYPINNKRLIHLLSQCAHESGDFKHVVENLNYSKEGLLATFPKYFNEETATLYSRKAEKIANIVYANRMGNGDKSSGDGWAFRGRGYIQITGRDNYTAFDKVVEDDILVNPSIISTKHPLLSACWFFDSNKLWNICDTGLTDEACKRLTKRINGGYNGLDDRILRMNKLNQLLSYGVR